VDEGKPVVLRGIPVTEPDTFERLRRSPLPLRVRLLEAAHRALSFGLSSLAHLIVALLLLDMVSRVLPDAGGGVVEVGLSARPGIPEPPTGLADAPRSDEAAQKPSLPTPVEDVQDETIGVKSITEAATKPDDRKPTVPALPNAAPAVDSPGALYGNRGSSREGAVAKFGGTKDSEEAVERALDWLVRHQERDGSWSFGVGRPSCPADSECRRQIPGNGNVPYDRARILDPATTGLTSLALLAFLGAGYTHRDGAHAETVSRAMKYVLARQSSDGGLANQGWTIRYEHGVATLMLAEAYGLTRDDKLVEPLRKAVAHLVKQQSPEGGWTYPGQPRGWEMTQSVWQLFALASARKQRFEVPMATLSRAARLLRAATNEDGWIVYSGGLNRTRGNVTTGALGAATFARMVIGVPSDERFEQSIQRIIEEPNDPLEVRTDAPFYFWYYKTLALFQLQNDAWRDWNERLREQLIARQVKEGHGAGCWVMRDATFDEDGRRLLTLESRVYVTALTTLMLEVYYRYLPFYRTTGSPELDLEAPLAEPDPADLAPLRKEPPKPDLRTRLNSASSYHRWTAAREAADAGRKDLARDVLAVVAREPSDIAGSMLECLGRIGDDALAGEIIPYLSDSRERVRRGAYAALKQITGSDLGPERADWESWWKGRQK